MNTTAEKSVLDELHRLLDTVDVDGSSDVSDFASSEFCPLGKTLFDVLNRSQKLTDRYAHIFKSNPDDPDSRFCHRCGQYLTDAIHIRSNP